MIRRLLAPALLCAAACGGGGPLTVDGYTRGLYSEAVAVYACEAGLAPEYVLAALGASSSSRVTAVAQTNKAIASGRLKFDGAKAQSCLDQLKVSISTCFGPSAAPLPLLAGPGPAECAAIYQGTVAVGGDCYSSSECVSGDCQLDSCPGKCIATAALGSSCGAVHCAPGGRCVGSICLAYGTAGDYCTFPNECKAGLVCAAGGCRPPINANASCDPGQTGNPCVSGHWCQPDPGGVRTGSCKPQAEAGQPCGALPGYGGPRTPQCKGNQVCAGYANDGNTVTLGHCSVPQDVGGACSSSSAPLYTGCFLGLLCQGTQCVALPGAGSPCASGSLCDPNTAFCSNSTCAALKADGEACARQTECLAGGCDITDHCGYSLPSCAEP